MALALAPSKGAVLIHNYALRGTLTDTLAGPSLTAVGGQITALGYVVTHSQGLKLTSPALTPVNYSVEFSFQISSVVGEMKLLDFHGLTDTTGLYLDNGRLSFGPGAAVAVTKISSDANHHVVLTRDGITNVVTGFLDGQEVFSFTDSVGATVVGANRELNFFRDNFDIRQTDAVDGTIGLIRIYNGVLTADEVKNLYSASVPLQIPEPSTLALLVAGLAAAAFMRRGRAKQ